MILLLKILTKKFNLILPIWLLGMILVCASIAAFPLLSQPEQTASIVHAQVAPAAIPQVLGASTDLRGQKTATTTEPETAPFDSGSVTANSFIVQDLGSEKILAQKEPDDKVSIASLTKLMTGLLAYENLDPSEEITITPQDQMSVSPVLNFQAGDKVKVQDVFNAMLIGSCNDAALTLANHTAAEKNANFVDLMNQKAADLGMRETHFSNPLGFENGQNYSTANDLLKLVAATQKLSAFTSLGKKTGYSFSGENGITYHTEATNKLIKTHEEIEAIKTGYTPQAGEAMINKVTENHHSILIIVLKSTQREKDTLNLERLVFDNTRW